MDITLTLKSKEDWEDAAESGNLELLVGRVDKKLYERPYAFSDDEQEQTKARVFDQLFSIIMRKKLMKTSSADAYAWQKKFENSLIMYTTLWHTDFGDMYVMEYEYKKERCYDVAWFE